MSRQALATPGSELPDILRRILAHKRAEVTARKTRRPLGLVERAARRAPAPRGFAEALRNAARVRGAGVIAEIKRASPSRGILREPFAPPWIARRYQATGAACLSVLTDQAFFGGADGDLVVARAACELPVLRKEFVLDPYQVFESRALGADCVLLIAAALDDPSLAELYRLTRALDMACLVEVHDSDELERALRLTPALLGINNRDLRRFETRLETSIELRAKVPPSVFCVAESGIAQVQDRIRLQQAHIPGFLVGEAFMRASDPGTALAALFFGEP